jgi:transketolase
VQSAANDATDRSQAGFDNQLGAYAELRDAIFGMKTLGASAPLKELLAKFRFTDDNVYVVAKHQLAHKE